MSVSNPPFGPLISGEFASISNLGRSVEISPSPERPI